MPLILAWIGGSWTQLGGTLEGSGFSASLNGGAIDLSDDGYTVAIGSPLHDGNGTNSGSVRIFDWHGTAWVKRGDDIEGPRPFLTFNGTMEVDIEDGADAGHYFGENLALSGDGNKIAIGARGASNPNCGVATPQETRCFGAFYVYDIESNENQ